MKWMPTCRHRDPDLMQVADHFLSAQLRYQGPLLFMLMGHSYEFERNNNWDLLDEICEKLAGKEDTWYATNIEIYDYVQAYNSLVYSADGTIIYNPSLFTLWFDIDGKSYSIQSGETIHIQDR